MNKIDYNIYKAIIKEKEQEKNIFILSKILKEAIEGLNQRGKEIISCNLFCDNIKGISKMALEKMDNFLVVYKIQQRFTLYYHRVWGSPPCDNPYSESFVNFYIIACSISDAFDCANNVLPYWAEPNSSYSLMPKTVKVENLEIVGKIDIVAYYQTKSELCVVG